jgi:F-box and WD-40 domain protein CDC4
VLSNLEELFSSHHATSVVTTTTTTVTYAPIPLPSLPIPISPKDPTEYPLHDVEIPAVARRFNLVFPNGARAMFNDGSQPADEETSTGGKSWRILQDDEQVEQVDLAGAVDLFCRKRSHESADMVERLELAADVAALGSASGSPPRKKARGVPLPAKPAEPLSPLPSPCGSPAPDNVWPSAPPSRMPSPQPLTPPAEAEPTPPLVPDLALTALLSLPSLVDHFSGLPQPLQAHFLLALVRRAPRPVLRTLHGVLAPTLACDFLTRLPRELVSMVLGYMPHSTLARASRVCKTWRAIIDADPVLWRDMLVSTGAWFGGASERAFASAIYATRRAQWNSEAEALPAPHPYKLLFQSRHLTAARWADNPTPQQVTVPAHGGAVVTCLLLTRGRVISASEDPAILVHSVAGELLHTLDGHAGGVWTLAATRDTLVSGSTDRTVRVWDLGAGRCTHVFGGHTSTVRCLAVVLPEWVDAPDGTRARWPRRPLVVSGSRDNSLRVWMLPRAGEPTYRVASDGLDGDSAAEDASRNPYFRFHLAGHDGAVRALAARGRTLVSGSYDCTVRVWDLVDGTATWVLEGHTQKVYSVAYDPTRHQAYSGAMDSTVRIWSLMDGACLHTLTGHTSLVGLLSLSPSSLVSAAADASVRVWDPDTGALRHALAGHTGAIICVQADATKVLSGADGSLRVWDVRAGAHTRNLLEGADGVWQVAAEGRWAAAASTRQDQTYLHVWDFALDQDGDDWVGEPIGGVYDESLDEHEDEDGSPCDGQLARRASDGKAPQRSLTAEQMQAYPDDVLQSPSLSERSVAEAVELDVADDEDDTAAPDDYPVSPLAGWTGEHMQPDSSGPHPSSRAGPSARTFAHALPAVEETPTRPRIRTGGSRRR